MHGFERALYDSLRLALDGDERVQFERLPLDPPPLERALGRDFVLVPEEGLAALAERAFFDTQFYVRPSLVASLAAVACSQESDGRDRYVARALIENMRISAGGVFPLCQDTGGAAAYGWKGERVLVQSPGSSGGASPGTTSPGLALPDDDNQEDHHDDCSILERAAMAAWKRGRFRNSQLAPLPGFEEVNTGTNAPLLGHISAVRGGAYRFLFVAKGGGSSNKTALYQETKRLLEPSLFTGFVEKLLDSLGVSACPPYRIALILGGQSSEEACLAAKLASHGALDGFPVSPPSGGSPYRDLQLEALVMEAAASSGWGAQFGGRFMARDARVIRLPRHAASLPVAVGVSCVAHRQAYAYVDREGWFVERLARAQDIERIVADAEASASLSAASPARSPVRSPAQPSARAPAQQAAAFGRARKIELGEPGSEGFKALIASLRSGELVELSGTVVLARDAAHARLLAMMERGEELPAWTRYPALYASPTETPPGSIIGSLGPTTSRRMDSYLDAFGARGVFPLTIGKGERGRAARDSCARYGGAYLAAIGGAAALTASRHVVSVELIDWPELGMEAIRLVELKDLPLLVALDSRGGDYYSETVSGARNRGSPA